MMTLCNNVGSKLQKTHTHKNNKKIKICTIQNIQILHTTMKRSYGLFFSVVVVVVVF